MDQHLHFTFSPAFSALLMDFVRDHYLDERTVFKKAWQVLRQQHDAVFVQEAVGLQAAGYKGNVEEKFFHAGRYYFRKKLLRQQEQEQEQEQEQDVSSLPPPRTTTTTATKRPISSTLLKKIDQHIRLVGVQSTPAAAYDAFHRSHQELVFAECHYRTEECLWDKLKKSYKNRYHTLKRELNQPPASLT